jgi:RNA polymerase sigma-70 factor (ECF subfamily)
VVDKQRSDEAERLVSRIRAGDARAEDEFVTLYTVALRRMLRALTTNAALAEDIHQEAFAIVLIRLRRRGLEDPSALGQYLRQTARKLVLSHARRGRAWQAHELNGAEMIDPAPGPLARVMSDEERELVRRAVDSTKPERYRQLLYRYYLAEETKDRICADLGLSDLHFNRVLFRARENFRKALAKQRRRAFKKE